MLPHHLKKTAARLTRCFSAVPAPEIESAADAAVATVLRDSLRLSPARSRLYVVYDRESPTSAALADAYLRAGVSRSAAVETRAAEFPVWEKHYGAASVGPALQEDIFSFVRPGDAVALVQSAAFHLDSYRFRLRLFERGVRAAEHAHLGLATPSQTLSYMRACAVSPSAMASEAAQLKGIMDTARTVTVRSSGGPGSGAREDCELVYAPVEDGGPVLEPSLLNTGYFPLVMHGPETRTSTSSTSSRTPETPSTSSSLSTSTPLLATARHIGGGYPVGEVFTEARSLTSVSGTAWVSAFPDQHRRVRACQPFAVHVQGGRITHIAANAPKDFTAVMAAVLGDEGELCVRELGVGLNPAMALAPGAMVHSLLAFERMRGVHLSIGRKHTVFHKEGMSRKQDLSRYHIDVFLAATELVADGKTVMQFPAPAPNLHEYAPGEVAW